MEQDLCLTKISLTTVVVLTHSILDRNLDQRHLDIFLGQKFTIFVSIFYSTFSAIEVSDRINLIKIQVRTYKLKY